MKPIVKAVGRHLPRKVTGLGVGHRVIGIANGMFGEYAVSNPAKGRGCGPETVIDEPKDVVVADDVHAPTHR